MECSEFRVLLRGLLDGGLGADNRMHMERHLGECLPCREEHETARELDLALVEALTPPSLSIDLADRIMAAVDPVSRARPRRMLRMWAAVAAAACFLLAIIGMAMFGAKKPRPTLQVLDGAVETTTDGKTWQPLAAREVADFATPCVYRAARDGEVRIGDTTLQALDDHNGFKIENGEVGETLHVLFGRFKVTTHDGGAPVQLCAAGGFWQAQGDAQWVLEIPSLPQVFDEQNPGVAGEAFLDDGMVCYVNAGGQSMPLEQNRRFYIQTDGRLADRRSMHLRNEDGAVEILEFGDGCFELTVSTDGRNTRTLTYGSPLEFQRKLPEVYVQYASLDEMGFGESRVLFNAAGDETAAFGVDGAYVVDDNGSLILVPDLADLQQNPETAYLFLADVRTKQQPMVRQSLMRILNNARNPYKISADGSGSIVVQAWVNDEQTLNSFATMQDLFESFGESTAEMRQMVVALQGAQIALQETESVVFVAGAVLAGVSPDELPADAPSAVLVLSVSPDSLLAKAQLAANDMIVRRKNDRGQWVATSVDDLQVQITALPAGQALTLDGLRDGKSALWVVKK